MLRLEPTDATREPDRREDRAIDGAILLAVTGPEGTHLGSHERRTALAILSHPASGNIEWRNVISLLESAGEVSEERNGKFKVTLGGETEVLERPTGKDIDEQMVVDLRRMLAGSGITADSLRGREPVASAPDAQPPSGHAILVIGYHGADIYPTDSAGSAPTRIIPEDPTGRLHTMHHKANNPDGWYGEIEKSWYAQLADAIRPASAILIVGNGKGHSNGMLKFTQYLTEHDPALLKRIVGSIESDSENLTEGELLALAREFYGDSPARDHGDGQWGEP